MYFGFFGEEEEVDTVQSQQNILFIYLFLRGFFRGDFALTFGINKTK